MLLLLFFLPQLDWEQFDNDKKEEFYKTIVKHVSPLKEVSSSPFPSTLLSSRGEERNMKKKKSQGSMISDSSDKISNTNTNNSNSSNEKPGINS
jgi:hypothetical protein